MTERETKEKRLRDSIVKCLILSDEDRDFWLSHASMLPNVVLDNVTKIIEDKNKVIDEYVGAALKNDKDHTYLAELKQRIQKIKEQAFALDESKEKKGAEASLKEQLKNLEE